MVIAEGYSVRVLRRYEQPLTEFFPTKEAAEAWIEEDRASHKPGPKRKIA